MKRVGNGLEPNPAPSSAGELAGLKHLPREVFTRVLSERSSRQPELQEAEGQGQKQ